MPHHMRRITMACAAAASIAALGGCGDDPAVCSDREQVEDSIQQLTRVDVRKDGIAALTGEFQEFTDASHPEVGPGS